MRILFIGDVVGAAGMTAVKSMLPDAISRWEVDLAVVNGENSAGAGFGITEDTYQGIRGAGADQCRWSGYGRFCCRSHLSFATNSDSVAPTLTSVGANDDGAAQSGPRAVALLLRSQ